MSAIASTNVTASTLVMSGDAVSGEEEDGGALGAGAPFDIGAR
jgi:hypothetical protein